MKKVLVLEDESSIRSFIVINLRRAGYEVVEAESGEEALEKLKLHSDVRVALLDIMLPGIDGFEVCRRIRATNASIGIIMLTARSQEMDKVTGLMTGADDYVTKPFSPAELTARVDALHKEVKALRKELDKTRAGAGQENLMDRAVDVDGVRLLAASVGTMSVQALRELMDDVRSKLPSGVACLAAEDNGKVQLILYVSKDLHERFTAPELIRIIAPAVGGSGGGRPDMAQAGGANPDGVDEAFRLLRERVQG